MVEKSQNLPKPAPKASPPKGSGAKQSAPTATKDKIRRTAPPALRRCFQKLIEYSQDLITLTNAQGEIVYANQVDPFLGYTSEEYQKLEPHTLIHPTDLADALIFWQVLQAAPGATKTIELRSRHKAGHYVWLEIKATNLLHDPEIGAFVSYSRDITARKSTEEALRQSEERYRAMVQEQTELLCRLDRAFRLTFANQAYSDAIGKPIDEMLGQSILDFIPVAHQASVIVHLRGLTPARPMAMIENPIIMADGQVRWFQWTNRLVFDPNGQTVEYQGVGCDITERRQAEEAERQQRRFAEALNRSLAALTSSLDVESVMQQILASAATVVPSEAGSIILFEGNEGRVAYLRGFPAEAEAFFKDYRFPMETSNGESGIANQNVYFVPDTQADPTWIYLPYAGWIRSSIGVPISLHNKVIGLLIVDSAIPNHFRMGDIEKLQAFARYASLALENAEHVTKLEKRVAERTAELQIAKERVEAILHNSFDGVLLVKPDLQIQQTNQAFNLLFTGSLENTFVGSLADLIQLDELPHVFALIEEILSTRTGGQVELRCYRKNGKVFDAELSLSPLRTNELVCTLRDITERKRTQHLLAEERNRLRALIDSIPDYIYIKDTEHRTVLSNLARARSFGLTPEETIGKNDFAFVPAEMAVQFHADEQALFRTGVPLVNREERTIGMDGSVIWASTTKVPLHNLQGELIGLVGITRNITEQKMRERQLRYYASLQGSMTDAVIATDLELRVQSWNRAAEILYGWRAEEAIGKTTSELYRTEYLAADSNKAARQKLFTEGHWEGEVRQLLKDGAERYVLSSVTLLKDEANLPFGVVGINHDITERKRAEEALQKSAAEFSDLYNNAPCGYHSLDRHGVIVQINDTELHWLGYTRDEVVGQLQILALLTPPSQEIFCTNFPQFQARGWVKNLEMDFISKTGRILTVLLSSTAIYAENGAYLSSRSTLYDITEQKRGQEAIRASEARYRLLADNITDLVTRVNLMGEYTYVSPSIQNVLGYAPEEVLGKSRYQFVHPDDLAMMQQGFNQALTQQITPPVITYRKQHKAGHYIWLETKSQVIYDQATGEVQEIIASSRDVTERKLAEEALHESETKFRRLVEVAPMAIIISDQKGKITLVNDQAELLFGYPRRELLGQLVEVLIPVAVQELHLLHRAGYLASGHRQQTGSSELFGRRKDGSEFPIEIELSHTETAAGLMVMSFITDITERKQAAAALREQRDFLQRVIDSVPNLIMVKDRAGRFELVNQPTAEIYGLTPTSMLGKTDNDIHSDVTETDVFYAQDQSVLASGQPLFIPESQFSDRYYQTNIIPLQNAMAQIDRLLVVCSDITERKQAEALLQQALAKEKELGELKSRFVSMASHEFRTPLASILALTETLRAYRHKLADTQIEERLGKIQEQIAYLKAIMEDVLQLARLQARRAEFNPMRLDLDALCRSVLDEFQSRPDSASPLNYHCDASLHDVYLDKKLMRQIINNLASNAYKYSIDNKPITVQLDTVPLNGIEKMLVVMVRDEGIGIPEADLLHLFEPFHRAANVGTISGTGLGLVITKESVELHGGTIKVESQVGAGTTFIVHIPLTSQGERNNAPNPGDRR